jgi:hypothetical protein
LVCHGVGVLRVTTTNQAETTTFKLEGRLAGPWVQEVTRVWSNTSRQPGECVVDLRSVTFIDAPGRALLTAMSRQGARFVASDILTRTIVDQIEKESSS